jgi:hypothetical protein
MKACSFLLGVLFVLITCGKAGAAYCPNSDFLTAEKEALKPTDEDRLDQEKEDYIYYLIKKRMTQISVCEFNALPANERFEIEIKYGTRWVIYPEKKKNKVIFIDALYSDTPNYKIMITVFEGSDTIDIDMPFNNDGSQKEITFPDGKKMKKIIHEEMEVNYKGEGFFRRTYSAKKK